MKAEKRAPQEDVVGEESQVKRQKVAEDRAPEWREYVHTFHCDRGHWKFNKRLQVCVWRPCVEKSPPVAVITVSLLESAVVFVCVCVCVPPLSLSLFLPFCGADRVAAAPV